MNCSCEHDRLLHDSWGCRLCTCNVSIIYLTSVDFQKVDAVDYDEVIKQGNELVAGHDRVAESHLNALYQRMIADRATAQ